MFTFDSEKRYFLKDGKPHFFKLDTAWMALTNLTVEEFREYAQFRRNQGYNGLLIQNTPAYQDMPKHVKFFPFEIRKDGSYDLSKFNEAYFAQAKEKMEILRDLDMTPFLVPMWVSFVPHSQMEKVFDCRGKQFESFEDYKRAVDFFIDLYKEFHPVWLIGGDAELDEENKTNWQYYSYMAEQIRQKCPGDLMSGHIAGGRELGASYLKNGYIDFYTYQSGHMLSTMKQFYSPATLAEKSWQREPVLPVMNLEPMYEAHGYGNRFGRFGAGDVRRAFWFSVLNGAKAGFAYGAHGIWMFYDGSGFNNEAWSKIPLNWRSALTLQGSYDMISSADLFERFQLFDTVPNRSLCLTPYEEIAVAASPDLSKIVAYTTATTHLDFAMDLTGYDCNWYLLDGKQRIDLPAVACKPGAEWIGEYEALSEGQLQKLEFAPAYREAPAISRVAMYQSNSDAVLVCIKK